MQVLQTRLTDLGMLLALWPVYPIAYGQGMCHPGVVLWLGGKKAVSGVLPWRE